MRERSLKLRLFVIGGITIIIALGITGLGLINLFERHVERRIGSELNTYITQIASRISFDSSGTAQLDGKLADPRFEKIYGGLYWQINNESAAQFLHSRSLWDVKLRLPEDRPEYGQVHVHKTRGPLDSKVLVHERRLRFNTIKGEQTLRLIVAVDQEELKRLNSEFASEVAITLFSLCAFLLLACWLQVTLGLGPLSLIQQSLSAIRNGTAARIDLDIPREVLPLANEVNDLLQAQETAIENARYRAADMAHTFKTPLTALKTDINRLRERGEHEIAMDIENISIIMQRQIERELTKTRVRDLRNMEPVRIRPALEAIISTLQRTPAGEEKNFQIDCKEDIEVLIDKDDLTEIIGNLIENAVKHAKNIIAVRVNMESEFIQFEIEDDGEGISSLSRDMATKRGVRLDQTQAGTGLGLAIVSDTLEAYGEKIELDKSPSGGLLARFRLSQTTNH